MGSYSCYILRWEFKAKCGEFITVRVVLFHNHVCSSKKKKEVKKKVKRRNIFVKSICVEKREKEKKRIK